jgi:hypothetical protein
MKALKRWKLRRRTGTHLRELNAKLAQEENERIRAAYARWPIQLAAVALSDLYFPDQIALLDGHLRSVVPDGSGSFGARGREEICRFLEESRYRRGGRSWLGAIRLANKDVRPQPFASVPISGLSPNAERVDIMLSCPFQGVIAMTTVALPRQDWDPLRAVVEADDVPGVSRHGDQWSPTSTVKLLKANV